MTEHNKPTFLNYLIPLLLIGIGIRHYYKHGFDVWVIIPVLLGAFALYMALFNRALFHRINMLIIKLWQPVGELITMILLGVTFYLIFAPVGLLLRLLRKDIIDKNPDISRGTYWSKRSKQGSNYTQQF